MGGCSFDWSATSKGSTGIGSFGHLATHLGRFLQPCDTFGPNPCHLATHLGPNFVNWLAVFVPSSCCKDRVVKSGSIWLLRQNKLACNYLCSKSGGYDLSHKIGQYLWLKALEGSHKTWITNRFDHDHHTGCVKACLGWIVQQQQLSREPPKQ